LLAIFLWNKEGKVKTMGVVRRCDDSLESTRIRFPDENETPFRSFPASFQADYPLPEHRERLLSMTNVFPSFDSKIEFFEEPHLYHFNKKVIEPPPPRPRKLPFLEMTFHPFFILDRKFFDFCVPSRVSFFSFNLTTKGPIRKRPLISFLQKKP